MKVSIRNNKDNLILDIYAAKIDNFLTILLRKTLFDLIRDNKTNIYINFSLVESINSEILGIILSAHRACQKKGGKISIYGLKPDLLLIFHIIQLDKYIKLYTNEKDALDNQNNLAKRRLRVIK